MLEFCRDAGEAARAHAHALAARGGCLGGWVAGCLGAWVPGCFLIVRLSLSRPPTQNYMSPERLTGEEYNFNSDVWALGMCIATCVLGSCPFSPDQRFWELLEQLEVPMKMIERTNVSLSNHPPSTCILSFIARRSSSATHHHLSVSLHPSTAAHQP